LRLFFVSLAIRQMAGVDLPGAGAFADNVFGCFRTAPRPQVAGTKNLFWFLDIHGWNDAGDEWDLFPLFSDRVIRAAENKLGLITLHAGLQ
jgi:hypothetical protein